MAAGDVWRIAFEGKLYAQQYVNVFHIKMLSVGATPSGAIAYLVTNWWDLWKANLVTRWTLEQARSRLMAYPQSLYDETLSVVGAAAGEGLPGQAAFVLSLKTGYAGRTKHGRLYIGGMPEVAQVDSSWTSAYVSSAQTIMDDLVAALGVNGSSPDYQWGVWSRKLGEPTPTSFNTAAGFAPISEVVVRSTVFTQRRRTIGVGG